MAKETEWRPIDGFSNYEVSDKGEIRRLDGKMMKSRKKKNGYAIVSLTDDAGKQQTLHVHRLVAEAFCLKEENDTDVNHLDENKDNNQADNLEFCTHSYNINYSKTGNSPISQYSTTGDFIARYVDMNEIIATHPNYNRTNIHMNLNCWTRTAYGYVWRYDLRDY